MLTAVQKRMLDIICIFENGRPETYYKLVCLMGDTGGLSGGLLMASLASGNLGKLLRLYRTMGGTSISEEEVRQTERMDPSQNTDPIIRNMFKASSSDPIMHEAQDTFFYNEFVKPAEAIAKTRGWTEPLAICLILDGLVHGSFKKIDGMVPKSLNQWDWARTYTQMRKQWLQGHNNPLLQKTVYRMEFFEQQINSNNWKLDTPMRVHGYDLR